MSSTAHPRLMTSFENYQNWLSATGPEAHYPIRQSNNNNEQGTKTMSDKNQDNYFAQGWRFEYTSIDLCRAVNDKQQLQTKLAPRCIVERILQESGVAK